MRFLSVFVLGFALALSAQQQNAGIRGQVLDPSGVAIPRAIVRVLDTRTRSTLGRTQSYTNGRFDIENLAPGDYLLAVSAKGFAEKLVPAAAAPQTIQLDILDCDAPGINCDLFTTKPYSDPHPVILARDLTLSPPAAIDLNRIASVPASSPDAEISFLIQNGGLYLAPTNKAALALQARNGACKLPSTPLPPLRLDGLGPGAEIIVRTIHHHCARLFVTRQIDPNITQVSFHIVTRR